MRIIALIDDAGIIERIIKHLKVSDARPESRSPADPEHPLLHPDTINQPLFPALRVSAT